MPKPLPNHWSAEPCLDLINSQWSDHLGADQRYDRLPLPVWRRAFLKHWGYRVDDPDDRNAVALLRRLRTALRLTLEAYINGTPLRPSLRREIQGEINRSRFVMRIARRAGKESMVLERAGRPWDVVTADLAMSAMRLIGESRLVKVCANPHCSWMFVDESKSGSRRWCEASICGSLVNVRRYRLAHRD